MFKKVTTVLLIAVFAVSLVLVGAGCKAATTKTTTAAETTAVAKKITVGFSLPFIEDSPYTFPFSTALKKEAAARGWTLIMTDAKGDVNTQSNQIEDMVSKGLDGLMIMPVDAKGIVAVIQKVGKETGGKLPIITSNVMTDPSKLPELRGFSGPNSYLEGKLMGATYIKILKDKGLATVNYAEMTGTAGYSASIDREKGFDDALKEANATGMFNRLDLQPGDWSPDKGQTITENWLTTFGDKLQLIYSHNDGMATGIVKALKNAGKKPGDILTNGCDGQTEAVQNIIDGWQTFTVFQSPAADAALSMSTMGKILKGEKTEYFIYLDTPIIDASNAKEYLPKVTEIWSGK